MKNNKIKFIITVLCVTLISATSFFGGYTVNKINADKKSSQNQENESEYNSGDSDFIHTIDKKERECLDSSHVYNYVVCSEQAEKEWNKEIEKNIKDIKKIMPSDDYDYIEQMNKDWEKSVNSRITVINKFISSKDGIIYQTEGQNDISELKKEYAIFLKSVYTNYKEETSGLF